MNRPSSFDSVVNPLSGDAGLNGPIDHAHTLALMFKNYVPTVIPRLLLGRRPLAVTWFVVAIVVLAIYLQAFFVAFPHVGFEVGEIGPAFADFYSPASIAWIFLILGICASAIHLTPNLMQWIVPAAVFRDDFLVQATATLRLAIQKAVNSDVANWTTARALSASKKVPRFGFFILKDAKNGKSSKNVTTLCRAGNRFNHRLNPLFRKHVF